uniref:Small ribosomal subunit protein uS3m n=1 Tax=Schizopora paradoxa TaxID=27342 RepID=A0A5B9RA27_9AGAM|nr:ribosomal protein S3 [Schizopora paradoxa]QEG57232.1 ribosomal protein S3 [Schizopora paradoxa]
MHNYKNRSQKHFDLKSEAILTKHLPLNKNIQNIQSLFKNIVTTEKSSEMLYNELKNKEGVNGPMHNTSSYPVLSSTNKRVNGEVNINELYNIDFLRSNTDSLDETVIQYKKNNLNSLYLTQLLKNNSISAAQDQSANLESSSTDSEGAQEYKYQTLLPYLNSLTQFNKKLAKHQHVFYQFNKANNKSYRFLFNKTTKLLNLTFLAMGCLMSKPIYKVIYTKNNLEFEHDTSALSLPNVERGILSKDFTTKILIDLSYFIRKNKHRYLYNNVEVNDNIIHISHPDDLNSEVTDSVNSKIKVSQRNNILCKYNDRFQNLTDYLNSIFKSEVELDLVRLHKVFYDGQILVQDIALKSYKFRFVKLVSKLFRRLHIQKMDYSNNLNKTEGLSLPSAPSYLSGINIKLAGRTFRQRVVPRMTVKRIQKGSLTNVNVQYIDRARFTGKTRRGAFSFTITLGHVFK